MFSNGEDTRPLFEIIVKNRFLFLLLYMLALFVATPLLSASMLGGHIADLLFMFAIMATFRCVERPGIRLVMSMCLAGFMASTVGSIIYPHPALYTVSLVLGLGILVLAIFEISDVIMKKRRVDTDTVLGGISVYLLMGLFWTMVYVFMELAFPGAFDFTVHSGKDLDILGYYVQLYYFSFVTLLTTGYGDIIPMSPYAQTCAILEGVIGQIYMVVFIARLVGLQVARAGARRE